ncbi:MAG: hypothetical protein AMJ61_12045 [Desulfobacterales bacterium SG8_35_2]|jgi:hypothetical protein|nr:MAG: hypothetical protein AMJ61_12045 [Desulfobacterales bacterium SG8_35_2]
MLYVERDDAGNIIALHNKPEQGADEKKSIMDEEILEFLNRNVDTDPRVHLLSLSDIGIIRILEDLINLLVRKNIILFTELPEEAQEKIRNRKRLREKISPDHLMADDIL